MEETWLYHCYPQTKQQSMEWRHSGSPRPKEFPVQKSAGKIPRPDFFGIKKLSSSLIIFQRTKLSTLSITLSAGAPEGHFEGKCPREFHKGVLFLHDNVPAHRALATQKKLDYLGFHCLDHTPYSPDQAPSDYQVFPRLKKQLKGRHFFPMRWSLLPRRPGLTDNILNFFEWLANVRAKG